MNLKHTIWTVAAAMSLSATVNAQPALPEPPAPGEANANAQADAQLAPAANDAGVARTVYFWNAAGGAERSRAGKWGNGEAATTRAVSFDGRDSLAVTTRSFGEGARFDLNPPIPLAPYQKAGYVRLRVRFTGGGRGGADGVPGAGRGRGRNRGGFPGGGAPGGFPGAGVPGGFAGANTELFGVQTQVEAQFNAPGGFPGGAPGGFPGGAQPGLPALPGLPGIGGRGGRGGRGPTQTTPITQLQVTLVLDRGVLTGYVPIDLNRLRPDPSGWYLFAFPVAGMNATPEAGGNVRRMLLTSDAGDTFYLAQAALVVETGQITVTIRRANDPIGAQIGEIQVQPGPLSLVADVEAGAADPEVRWNFDADGVGLPRTDAPAAPGGGFPGAGGLPGAGAPGGAPGNFPGAGGATGRGPGAGAPTGFPGAGDAGTAVPLGPRVDARGLNATFTYPNEEQDYRVEVTVRDRAGKKAPVTASVLVKVRG